MVGTKAAQLLRRVAARRRAASFGARLHLLYLVLAGAYAALLCVSRLLGLLPNWFTPLTLLAPLLAAPALALIFMRRPPPTEAARLVDARAGTKDLYLTAVLIDRSVGDYRPLVLADAESHAGGILPSRVAPFRWKAGARNMLVASALLLAGALFLPQLDPFARQEARKRVLDRARQIEESRKAVALRTELLKKQQTDTELSKEAQEKLAELKKTLDTAKPPEKVANLAALNLNQKDLASLWRKTSERRLKDALSRTPPAQQFGALSPKASEWKQQLAKGDTAGLKKELTELDDLAQKLARMPENNDKERLRQELKERMKEMGDFMAKEANSAPLKAALDRALEQLALEGTKGLTAEAMKALQESLKLTELELAALAQNIRDLKELEEGLQAIQLAKRLNDLGQFNGEEIQNKGLG